jgi:glyoxylase-like metal-dependent hydrolase (beta-lactamase superfamily II)
MSAKPTRRVIGRGERVLPGVWRLRLPLPWPGIPHCNAWAVARGDGVVLFDTGMHQPGSLAHMERAMEQVGLRIEHVRLIVCTHAHADHCGQAMSIAERAGCEVWMHPNRAHLLATADDPDQMIARRVEIARQSGVPEEPLQRWAKERREGGTGVAGTLRVDRDLTDGVVVETDVGAFTAIETPGHAPSHVVLHQPERRMMITGDHVLGRVSHYYDYGFTPDPVAEFLGSLDRVEKLDVRLSLAGHGRPFTDFEGHVEANRALVRERLDAVMQALAAGPATAFEIAPRVYGEFFSPATVAWLLGKTLCYLTHLEARGDAVRLDAAGLEPAQADRWALAA